MPRIAKEKRHDDFSAKSIVMRFNNANRKRYINFDHLELLAIADSARGFPILPHEILMEDQRLRGRAMPFEQLAADLAQRYASINSKEIMTRIRAYERACKDFHATQMAMGSRVPQLPEKYVPDHRAPPHAFEAISQGQNLAMQSSQTSFTFDPAINNGQNMGMGVQTEFQQLLLNPHSAWYQAQFNEDTRFGFNLNATPNAQQQQQQQQVQFPLQIQDQVQVQGGNTLMFPINNGVQMPEQMQTQLQGVYAPFPAQDQNQTRLQLGDPVMDMQMETELVPFQLDEEDEEDKQQQPPPQIEPIAQEQTTTDPTHPNDQDDEPEQLPSPPSSLHEPFNPGEDFTVFPAAPSTSVPASGEEEEQGTSTSAPAPEGDDTTFALPSADATQDQAQDLANFSTLFGTPSSLNTPFAPMHFDEAGWALELPQTPVQAQAQESSQAQEQESSQEPSQAQEQTQTQTEVSSCAAAAEQEQEQEANTALTPAFMLEMETALQRELQRAQ